MTKQTQKPKVQDDTLEGKVNSRGNSRRKRSQSQQAHTIPFGSLGMTASSWGLLSEVTRFRLEMKMGKCSVRGKGKGKGKAGITAEHAHLGWEQPCPLRWRAGERPGSGNTACLPRMVGHPLRCSLSLVIRTGEALKQINTQDKLGSRAEHLYTLLPQNFSPHSSSTTRQQDNQCAAKTDEEVKSTHPLFACLQLHGCRSTPSMPRGLQPHSHGGAN